MGALPPGAVREFEPRIMVARAGRSHRWVMELSFHREIQRSTSFGQPATSEFPARAKWRLFQTYAPNALVSLDNAVVVIDGMTFCFLTLASL